MPAKAGTQGSTNTTDPRTRTHADGKKKGGIADAAPMRTRNRAVAYFFFSSSSASIWSMVSFMRFSSAWYGTGVARSTPLAFSSW